MFKLIVNIHPLNDQGNFQSPRRDNLFIILFYYLYYLLFYYLLIIYTNYPNYPCPHTGLALTLGALVRERAPPGRGLLKYHAFL